MTRFGILPYSSHRQHRDGGGSSVSSARCEASADNRKGKRETHGRADLPGYIGIHTLSICRDRPSSAHTVTTITPSHGDRCHYASTTNPNTDHAYD
jgi:hypothetical protein